MLVVQVSILFVVVTIAESLAFDECVDLFKNHDPTSCCTYPEPYYTDERIDECQNRCTSLSDDYCCISDCQEIILEFGVDGKINVDSVTAAFMLGFSDKNLSSEDWLPVIEKSTKTCQMIASLYEGETCPPTKHYFWPVMGCVLQMNFLNCPVSSYKASPECDSMKTFIQNLDKCGKKYGDTFIAFSDLWLQSEQEPEAEEESTTSLAPVTGK